MNLSSAYNKLDGLVTTLAAGCNLSSSSSSAAVGLVIFLTGKASWRTSTRPRRFFGDLGSRCRSSTPSSRVDRMRRRLLLLLGLGSRVVSVPLIFIMLVAYATRTRKRCTRFFPTRTNSPARRRSSSCSRA